MVFRVICGLSGTNAREGVEIFAEEDEGLHLGTSSVAMQAGNSIWQRNDRHVGPNVNPLLTIGDAAFDA